MYPKKISTILSEAIFPSDMDGIRLFQQMNENKIIMDEQFTRVNKAMKTWLIEHDKTQIELARAMGVSPQVLQRYVMGKNKGMTPQMVEKLINEGIAKL